MAMAWETNDVNGEKKEKEIDQVGGGIFFRKVLIRKYMDFTSVEGIILFFRRYVRMSTGSDWTQPTI